MPQAPREYATELLAEARETHPWLHHRLFRMICDGELSRDQVRNVVREQGTFPPGFAHVPVPRLSSELKR